MRKIILFLFVCILLCGTARAASFDQWWNWLYRYVRVAKTNVVSIDASMTISQDEHNVYISIGTNNPGSNAWAWVVSHSNAVAYMESFTNQYDNWSNAWAWVVAHSNSFAYMEGWTNQYDNWSNAWEYVKNNSGVDTFTETNTLSITNYFVLVNASNNAVRLNLLPAAGLREKQYVIKKIDVSGHSVTIDPNASETIDGSTNAVLSSQHETLPIICDGSNWFIY